MVHDQTKSDMWFHDATMPCAIIGNWLYYLRNANHDFSKDEIKEIAGKIAMQNDKIRGILQEQYIEMRRVEAAADKNHNG